MAKDKWRDKNYDSALEDVMAGLALSPQDICIKASLLSRKGTVFGVRGLEDQEEKLYTQAIEIYPKFSWPHNNLGSLYM